MESNKQVQKAGENSKQVQVETLIVNQGISEERVRTIFSEMVPHALEIYTNEAYAIANQRIVRVKAFDCVPNLVFHLKSPLLNV